jgi:hypothetical protein
MVAVFVLASLGALGVAVGLDRPEDRPRLFRIFVVLEVRHGFLDEVA